MCTTRADRIDLRGSLQGEQRRCIRLTYRSHLITESEEHAALLISEIMSVAINKNLEHAIGGALHYNPKSKAIVQLLEGAEPAVRRLYANICKDPRHDDMQVIDDVPIGEGTDCVFTSFGMHIHESTSFAPSTTGLVRSRTVAATSFQFDVALPTVFPSPAQLCCPRLSDG